MKNQFKKIALLTSGGDAPGMNAAIRSVVRTCVFHKIVPFGVSKGYDGLISGKMIEMNARSVKGIINKGGTILKTARSKDFRSKEGRKKAFETLKNNNIDGLIVRERDYPETSKLMYKASSGAIEYVNIFEVSNINSTLKNLREKNFWVYGFDAKGQKDFTEIKWEGNNILLFGSEGFGMRQHTSKYADFFVKININEDIESLNISNSAAIVFHHLSYLKKKS